MENAKTLTQDECFDGSCFYNLASRCFQYAKNSETKMRHVLTFKTGHVLVILAFSSSVEFFILTKPIIIIILLPAKPIALFVIGLISR